ncbi:hypothetical protein [Streptomyces albospinus]|uniref:hypothetical protein n=1 Tax=Streptomyces albospinus TaxID=285515 RepID=UPI0016705AC6|nr:hypothetical protein [Streptomyces albospinus]
MPRKDAQDDRLRLVQGRESTGQTHVALVHTVGDGSNSPTVVKIRVLIDSETKGGPSAPAAVTSFAGSAGPRTIVVLPAGCAGKLLHTQVPGGNRIDWGNDSTGELVLDKPMVSKRGSVKVGCGTASGDSSWVLSFADSARTSQSGTVELFTGD